MLLCNVDFTKFLQNGKSKFPYFAQREWKGREMRMTPRVFVKLSFHKMKHFHEIILFYVKEKFCYSTHCGYVFVFQNGCTNGIYNSIL